MRKITAIMITPCAAFCATLVVLMAGLLLWDPGPLPAGEFRTAFVLFLEKWQTLAAGVLALIGAALVLLAARWQIAHERRLDQERRNNEIRTARMRLVVPLDILGREYNGVIYDLDNYRTSDGTIGILHKRLELPSSATAPSELIGLPDEEARGLSYFARDLMLINGTVEAMFEVFDDDLALTYLVGQTAQACIDALHWRNILAAAIGWPELRFSQVRAEELARLANDAPEAGSLDYLQAEI